MVITNWVMGGEWKDVEDIGWKMVEVLDHFQTNRGFPYFVTRWINEDATLEAFIVIDGEHKNCGLFHTHDEAVMCAKDFVRTNSHYCVYHPHD